jgi:hypothetical protein
MARQVFRPTTRKQVEPKPFVVFDIESKPAYPGEPINTAFLGGGVYDGKSYKLHKTVDELTRDLLSPAYEGHWIYAHNGSGYDFHYVFDYICRNNIDFEAYKTGERFFLACERRQFLDSMAVLRGSLAKAAKSLGVKHQKWDVPEDFYQNIERYDWQGYLLDDCRALYECIDTLRQAFQALGGNLKATAAATAMDLFRRQYLDQEIYPISYGVLEDNIRQAYTGGRVEKFKERMGSGASFDINSSYPFRMLRDVPTNCLGAYRNSVPDFGVVDVTIDIPSDDYIPPIATMIEGKLYFATGIRRQWITVEEARFVYERYGSKSIEVHSCIAYEGAPIFKRYIEDMYKIRLKAKREKNGAMDEASKLAMNTLYGKTGMKRERTKIVKGAKWRDWPYNDEQAYERLKRLQSRVTKNLKRKTIIKEVISHELGIFGIPSFTNKAAYILPAIAASITAGARLYLQQFLDIGAQDSIYCDTDSVYVEGEEVAKKFEPFCGKELGDIKRELDIVDGWFPFPKCYLVNTPNGEIVGKAKGLKRKSIDDVVNYLNGEKQQIPRMLGIMEKLRRTGETAPRSEWSPKGVAQVAPKRHPEGRPFSMEEIQWLNSQDG